MKRTIIKAILAFTITVSLSVSCSDDFVQKEAVYSIGSDNYFNSEEEYYKGLIAAYDILQSTYVNVILGEIASDNTFSGGADANDVIGWQQVDEMAHTSVNSNIRDVWNWMFAGVNRASYILEFKDKTDFEGKAQIIAEARFLRAYYQFELVKWFGGIPMKGDARFELGDETTIQRSPVADVYAAIENDLTLAIADLNPVAPQVGRVTKGAAQALLGKVYLFQGKYDQAGPMLDNVINSGMYQLAKESNAAAKDKYSNLFEEIAENGIESVFEVQYTDVEGAGFGCLQCSEGNVAVGFSGPRSYTGPMFTPGFSFNVPTPAGVAIFEDGDTRRDVTILDMPKWIAANPGAGYVPAYKDTGYFNRKYIPRVRRDEAAGDRNLTNPNNYRAIRYADVLLMAAEAFSQTNNAGKAQSYVNEVRRRAFGNNNHDITSSGAQLTQDILDERQRELFGEGHRFFDLVRTGQAAAKIPGFVAGKNELFPIPFEEIRFSNNLWEQNPQYTN
ncbi:RagB/SusD family nutrient uptake outer membrane protein [Flavobacterium sp. DG1-102-2]|uniref:RagB/SusD family nutrient uptake outer membrane protein n=1 Tax=Flavobacterium sp. DG1-102-2 TaxID=3081663 RepID=UPI002949B7EC|nr:RagB/SusD family nutrient uptake outer membrane protein [Flavobacterium sp. DG1-102-2]MDV6168565.1 RagB/SusD family nutrient uptake outer membrane protein [Flavobacterium sp. DG1-102-2]